MTYEEVSLDRDTYDCHPAVVFELVRRKRFDWFSSNCRPYKLLFVDGYVFYRRKGVCRWFRLPRDGETAPFIKRSHAVILNAGKCLLNFTEYGDPFMFNLEEANGESDNEKLINMTGYEETFYRNRSFFPDGSGYLHVGVKRDNGKQSIKIVRLV